MAAKKFPQLSTETDNGGRERTGTYSDVAESGVQHPLGVEDPQDPLPCIHREDNPVGQVDL